MVPVAFELEHIYLLHKGIFTIKQKGTKVSIVW